MTLAPKTRISHFEIISEIGKGGMGEVYLANDLHLARPVALKVLSAEIVTNEDRVQRFMHEARAASALNHPHILTVYALGEERRENGDTVHFISMEFVDGKTLDELIYSESVRLSDVLRYLAQAAKGLAKAHSAGILHRDLKPENIMVSTDGFAKILDFGLAKLTDSAGALHDLQQHKSKSGIILGTLGYMSPEQARGHRIIDHSSDIFSFGCILYEAIAKRKAFESDTAVDSLHAIIHSQPTPLRELDPAISPELDDLVANCLRKDPAERSLNAGQISELLEAIADNVGESRLAPVPSPDAKTMIRQQDTTREGYSRSFSGQRRQITAVFVDASAVADLLEDLDPEDSLQKLNALWTALDKQIVKSGGKVSESLAGTGLAVWGTRRISESDPETAVRAALELQELASRFFRENLSRELVLSESEIEEIERSNLLRIGISTGTVLIGNSVETGEFLTSGSAVNKAKRLLSKTTLGEIFISHDTYRHVRGIFVAAEARHDGVEPQKHRRQERRIYSISGIKPKAFRSVARGVEGIETSLIGREAELIKLRDAFDAVSEDNELQVVTILGEAGLGKSRLLFEFNDELDLSKHKFSVFKARAQESMSDSPFSLVKELFSNYFDIQESDPEHTAREKFVTGVCDLAAAAKEELGGRDECEMKAAFLGQLIGFDFSGSPHLQGILEDERQIRDRAFLYSFQLFRSISVEFPAVFYLDDLHWADDESLDYFDRLTAECADSALLMIELARPLLYERRPHRGEGTQNRVRLELQPLTKRETVRLVKSILQKAKEIPESFLDLLVSSTEGNPFYLEELIKMLIEQSVVSTEDENWSVDASRIGRISVPTTLNGVLQSRLDNLSPWEKRVVQRASVIGRDFWDSALSGFARDVSIATILESLRKKEIIYRKEKSSFDGATEFVFKHALLRDVAYDTLLIEERRRWHRETAEWLLDVKGERRNEVPALIAEHFAKAGEVEISALWYGKAAEQARKSHALEKAETLYRKVLSIWNELGNKDQSQVLKIEMVMGWKRGLGMVYQTQAKFRESKVAFEDLLETAKRSDNKLWQAQAHWGLSISQFEAGENRESLRSAIESVRLARECDPVLQGEALLLQAMGMYRQGRSLVSLGKFEEAIEIAERTLELLGTVETGSSAVRANCMHLLAAANMFLGRFREAEEFELKEVEISEKIGDLRSVGNGLNSLGFQRYMRGDGPKAIEYYERSLGIAREIGNRTGEIMVRSNICGAKVLLRDYETAEAGIRRLIEEVGDRGHFLLPEMYRFLSEALLGLGRIDQALEAARRSLDSSLENNNQETLGEAWRVLGVISSLSEADIPIDEKEASAVDCFEESIRVFESLKMEANLGQTLENFARHCLRSGDQTRAKDLLASSKEISMKLDLATEAKSPYFSL